MKYWITIYLYRSVGSNDSTWNVANEVHSGDLSSWFEEQREYEQQETRLLNAIEINKEEYDELRDYLS